MTDLGGRIGGGALAVLGVIISTAFVLVFLGFVSPIVHSICLTGDPGSPHVESNWGFYLTEGFPNPAPDDARCVRNTPDREALSALGIWPLGTPESQLANHLSN